MQAEIVGDRSQKLLAGPENSREAVLELQTRLDRLQITRPDLFVARLGELIYLANVLMAGSWYQGARFNEAEAARAALSCANLGLDLLLDDRSDDHGGGSIAVSSTRRSNDRQESCGCSGSAGIGCKPCRCAARSACSKRCVPITFARN